MKYADEIYGNTTIDGIFEEPIPVAGDMGDSHGALFAQQCWEPGMGKCTMGTGCSIMMNIGDKPRRSKSRLNTSLAWGMSGKVEYVFEGVIVFQGDTVKWLRDEMGFIENSAQSEEYANRVDSCDGVYFVPAFSGLGTPYWRVDVRAMIYGMNRSTNKYHIVRAGLESSTYQIRDIIEPMKREAGVELNEFRMDGGPANNAMLMQFTADILNTKLLCNDVEELSALGAAYAGGLAVGFFKDRSEIASLFKSSTSYEPKMDREKAEALYQGWKDAVKHLL